MERAVFVRTPASIMAESSQPKLEMTNVRVHILSKMKNHESTRKAMATLRLSSARAEVMPWACSAMAPEAMEELARGGWRFCALEARPQEGGCRVLKNEDQLVN